MLSIDALSSDPEKLVYDQPIQHRITFATDKETITTAKHMRVYLFTKQKLTLLVEVAQSCQD